MGGQGLCSVTADQNKILIITSQAAKQWIDVFCVHKLGFLMFMKTIGIVHPYRMEYFKASIFVFEWRSYFWSQFTFNSTLTWRDHIVKVLIRGKQRHGQLYRCHDFINSHDLSILYKSWIRPAIEYGCVSYSGAVPTHLHRFNTLQTHVEHTYALYFHLYTIIEMQHLFVGC